MDARRHDHGGRHVRFRAAVDRQRNLLGGDWWPAELGRPSSSGGQNDAAYAYFPGPRRLAIRRAGGTTLYDTGDHSISGVQQQQGGRGSLEFSSQFGTFTVDSLHVVEGGAAPGGSPTAPPLVHPAASVEQPVVPKASATGSPTGVTTTPAEIGAAIETLAGLRDKGFLTNDEFTAKKNDLLARL